MIYHNSFQILEYNIVTKFELADGISKDSSLIFKLFDKNYIIPITHSHLNYVDSETIYNTCNKCIVVPLLYHIPHILENSRTFSKKKVPLDC